MDVVIVDRKEDMARSIVDRNSAGWKYFRRTKLMSKPKWPATVPVLEARDLCQGPFSDGEKKCTVEWAWHVFGDSICMNGSEGRPILWSALNNAAIDLGAEFTRPLQDPQDDSPERYSDNKKNTRTVVARIWNRAMARLGYVVGNPEAKHLTHPQAAD